MCRSNMNQSQINHSDYCYRFPPCDFATDTCIERQQWFNWLTCIRWIFALMINRLSILSLVTYWSDWAIECKGDVIHLPSLRNTFRHYRPTWDSSKFFTLKCRNIKIEVCVLMNENVFQLIIDFRRIEMNSVGTNSMREYVLIIFSHKKFHCYFLNIFK